jgi:putative SOS response-associated peptidase YedK
MCGRYSFDDIREIYEVRSIIEDVASRLGEDTAAGIKRGEVFPSETAAVVTQVSPGLCCNVMSWGYPISQKSRLIINAKSENIFDLEIFRKSLREKKCVIPCTGFFEWNHTGGNKTKYIIRPQGEDFFYLAGLYDSYYIKGEKKNRFVILTAPANLQMKEIHGRMPLIVLKNAAGDWLHNKTDQMGIKKIYNMSGNLDIAEA